MKKLRAKITFIVFLSVLVVFALALTVVHYALLYNQTAQEDAMTAIIAQNNGHIPGIKEYEESEDQRKILRFDAEMQFRTRYFVVFFDEDDNITDADVSHIASVDEYEAYNMALSIMSDAQDDIVGYYGNFRFRITETEYGIIMIFLDCSENISTHRSTVMIVGGSLIGFSGLITFFFAIFSKAIFVPFEENSRRQKQFITDASHELKTPLAIISANAEVLGYKYGDNEWLGNITGQTVRMGNLINELLVLSKAEELETPDFSPVDMSSLTQTKLHEFDGIFEQKNVTVNSDITPGITVSGVDKQLEMLVSILIENASKYVGESGRVNITLKKAGRKAVFSVENTADIPEDLNLKNLFERFYRADSSHSSKTGGHGIGLSIAKKITDLHKGSIAAERTSDGIRFTAELRLLAKKRGTT